MTSAPGSPPIHTTSSNQPPGVFVEIDRPCFKCSYNLKGLPIMGVCPECGMPVQDSLKGILLRFASPEYLATIRSGLSLILNGIILSIVVGVGSILVSLVFAFKVAAAVRTGTTVGTGDALAICIGIANLVPTAMIFLGYWRFTQPDPGFVGLERPDSARKIIRIAIGVQAAFQVVHLAFGLIATVLSRGSAISDLIKTFAAILSFASLAAWAVQFFAMMLYLRWLAARLPDLFVLKRSKTYMWLLPLLGTVGVVVFIGPIVALVLYWNLLDRVRKHLRSIAESGQLAPLAGTTA